MSTNIYLIGCSPANAAAVMRERSWWCTEESLSGQDPRRGQGERRASEGLVITHQHTLGYSLVYK